jgi:hypothetical protein
MKFLVGKKQIVAKYFNSSKRIPIENYVASLVLPICLLIKVNKKVVTKVYLIEGAIKDFKDFKATVIEKLEKT